MSTLATNTPTNHFGNLYQKTNQNPTQENYEKNLLAEETRRRYNNLLISNPNQIIPYYKTKQSYDYKNPDPRVMKGLHLYTLSVVTLEGKKLEKETIARNTSADRKFKVNQSNYEMAKKELYFAKEKAYEAFKDKSFTFEVPPQANQIKVYDWVVNFPCLQELRTTFGLATMAGYEKEQQPAFFDVITHRNHYVVYPGIMYSSASEAYYKYWKGLEIPEVQKNMITSYDALEIPDCTSFGLTSTCRYMNCQSKWTMFAEYFKQKQKKEIDEGIDDPIQVMMMVTHHFRLRVKDVNQGLLPRRKGFEYMQFANLFTLKIKIDKQNGKKADVKIDVIIQGYPDKGIFAKTGLSTPTPPMAGAGVIYLPHAEYLDTDPIKEGIREAFDIEYTFSGTMTLSRHGNAIHNKPIDTPDQRDRINSSLTLLAVLQAKIAANELIPILKGNKVMLVTSFLGRTQLTGALLLQYAGATMSEKLLQFTEYMKYQAYCRFFKTGSSMEIFEVKNCSPFGDENYVNHNPVEMFKEIKDEAKRFKSIVFPTKGGQSRKSKKKTKTRRRYR